MGLGVRGLHLVIFPEGLGMLFRIRVCMVFAICSISGLGPCNTSWIWSLEPLMLHIFCSSLKLDILMLHDICSSLELDHARSFISHSTCSILELENLL